MYYGWMYRTYMVNMRMGAHQYVDYIYQQIHWNHLAADIAIKSLVLVPYQG